MALSEGSFAQDRLSGWLQERCDLTEGSLDSYSNFHLDTLKNPEDMPSLRRQVVSSQAGIQTNLATRPATRSPSSPLSHGSLADAQQPITPPGPQSTTPQSSPGRASHEFTPVAKDQMAGDYPADRCWACEMRYPPPHHCHVIAICDQQPERWMDANAFPRNFTKKDSSNGVKLCPNCHALFDDAYNPLFVFFPTDLQYFIDYEKRNAKERNTEGYGGSRRVPTAIEYRQYQEDRGDLALGRKGGLYFRTFLTATAPEDYPRFSRYKTWHGEPIYAIRRAIHLLGTPQANLLPSKFRQRLLELYELYFFDDPQNCRYWEPSTTAESTNESPKPPSDNRSDGRMEYSGSQGGAPKRPIAVDPGDNNVEDNPSPSKRPKDGPADITSSSLGYSYPVDDYDWTNDWLFGPHRATEDTLRGFSYSFAEA
ncbi:unnamed protein product [Penicillium pancosmium]